MLEVWKMQKKEYLYIYNVAQKVQTRMDGDVAGYQMVTIRQHWGLEIACSLEAARLKLQNLRALKRKGTDT